MIQPNRYRFAGSDRRWLMCWLPFAPANPWTHRRNGQNRGRTTD